jgi:hypothetical protein
MRIHEYRAKDKKTKQWITSDGCGWFEFWKRWQSGKLLSNTVTEGIGLKDAKRHKLYEGDILLWPQTWMYKEQYGVIRWVVNGWYFKNGTVQWLLGKNVRAVRVGNKFDHPKLMESTID